MICFRFGAAWAIVSGLTGIVALGCNTDSERTSVAGAGGALNCEPQTCSWCPAGTSHMFPCANFSYCDCRTPAPQTPVSDASTDASTPVNTFDACGGEPFGEWTLQSVNASQLQRLSNCGPGVISSNPQFHLQLKSGGVFNVDSRVDVTFTAPLSCLQQYFGTSNSTCNSLDLNGGTCAAAQQSGACDCTSHVSALYVRELGITAASWTRSSTSLSLGSSNSAQFNYCMKGTTLELYDANGGIRYVLQRTYHVGKPAACAARTLQTCAPGTGCHIGTCSGVTQCNAATAEANCTNIAGCSWDPSGCAGTANSYCQFQDFGLVPGCQLVTVPPNCVGTAPKCAQQVFCGSTPGCSIGSGCKGGVYNCSGNAGVAIGCTCTAADPCTTYDCADQTLATCPLVDFCSIDSQACIGTVTPCSQLSADICEDTVGCSLQASGS